MRSSQSIIGSLVLLGLVLACDDGPHLESHAAADAGVVTEPDAGGSIEPTAGAGGALAAGGSIGVAAETGQGGGGASGDAQQVPYRAIAIATAITHTCILLDDHQVKCFGDNSQGQLGRGDNVSNSYAQGLADVPVIDLGTGRSALALSAAGFSTCALLDDHSVKCWGFQKLAPVPEPNSGNFGDDPGEMGDALPAADLGPGRSAVQVALGYDAAFALLDDGSILRWPPLEQYASADGEVVQVVPYGFSALARYADGSVGVPGYGRAFTQGAKAISVITDGSLRMCATLDDGSIWCSSGADPTDWYEWTSQPTPSGLAFLYLNSSAYCLITELGAVRCPFTTGVYDHMQVDWGMPNVPGWWQQGTIDPNHTAQVRLGGKAVALSAGGDNYMCALMADGNVKCWGGGEGSIMVADAAADEMLPAIDLGTHWLQDPPEPVDATLPPDPTEYPPFCGDGLVQADEECDDANPFASDDCTNSCTVPMCGDGSIWEGHELDDPGAVMMNDGCGVACDDPHSGFGFATVTVSADEFMCQANDIGAVYCWGANDDGALGICNSETLGDQPDELGSVRPWVSLGIDADAMSLAAGGRHACALLSNGHLKCWGDNSSGQLGTGDTTTHGDLPGTMGADLPTVDLGSVTIQAVTAGGANTCIYTAPEGEYKCWGDNSSGQLGLGNTDNRGDDADEQGDALATGFHYGSDLYAYQVVFGRAHACAVLQTTEVKCWGDNSHGQLGLGDTDNRGDDPDEMGDNLLFVDYGPVDVSWVPQIHARGDTTCIRLENGVKCWGDNSHGQLGLGDTDNRGDGPDEMGENLPFIDVGLSGTLQLFMGPQHICATGDEGLKCWGANGSAQLGLGDLDDRGDEPNEMGSDLPLIDLGVGYGAGNMLLGAGHSCTEGLRCWGANDRGQLGQDIVAPDRLIVGDSFSEMGDGLTYPPL
jgi:cysteine-rich repeat protein